MATLPYANPDGMVVWDPQRGYVTVPRTNSVTVPGVATGGAAAVPPPAASPPPFLRVPMPWDTPSGFDPTMTNATYEHQKPVWDQSLSNTDMANWERTFQLYDQSQLAAAQAKWDSDMAQYGGMLPGGGVMGPRPTGSAPASMQGPTSSRISDQQMFDYYTQLAALKGADGTIDPTAAAALMSSMRGNAGFNELPGSIRAAISRFNGEQGWNGQQNPQYSADNLQALLDALAGRGFNAPPPSPREPSRGPRDQTKEIYERRLQAGNNPDPAGGGDTMIPDPRAVYNPRPGGDSPYAPPSPVENFDGGWMSGGGVGVGSSGTGYTSGPMRDAPQSLPGTTSRWNDPRPGLGSPFPRPRETYGNPDLQGGGGWGRGWNPQGWRQGSPWDRTRPQMGGGWDQWPRGQQDPTQVQLPTDRMPRYQTPPWAPYNGRPGGDSPYAPPRPGGVISRDFDSGSTPVGGWENMRRYPPRSAGQYVTGPAWGEDFNRGPQYTWGRGGGWGRGLPPRDPGDPGHGNYRPPDGYTGPLPSGMNGGGMPQPGGFRGWRS